MRIATADCSPSGLSHIRSGGLASGPTESGTVSSSVCSFASRYPGCCTASAYKPQRHVVDEHAPVDLGEVDAPFAAVDERIERADDVVSIDAEVEREVIASAGRYARIRQVELRSDHRDDRLRPVASGHRERVGALLNRVADEMLEVLSAP